MKAITFLPLTTPLQIHDIPLDALRQVIRKNDTVTCRTKQCGGIKGVHIFVYQTTRVSLLVDVACNNGHHCKFFFFLRFEGQKISLVETDYVNVRRRRNDPYGLRNDCCVSKKLSGVGVRC